MQGLEDAGLLVVGAGEVRDTMGVIQGIGEQTEPVEGVQSILYCDPVRIVLGGAKDGRQALPQFPHSSGFSPTRVAGKFVQKYTLRRYPFFFKWIQATCADFPHRADVTCTFNLAGYPWNTPCPPPETHSDLESSITLGVKSHERTSLPSP